MYSLLKSPIKNIISLTLIQGLSVLTVLGAFNPQNESNYTQLPTQYNSRFSNRERAVNYKANPITASTAQRVTISSKSSDYTSNPTPSQTATPQTRTSNPYQTVTELDGLLFRLENNQLTEYTFPNDGRNLDYIVYYLSSSRCPHCQKFTPGFVKAYAQLKAKYNNFEVILIDFDSNEKAMVNYMNKHQMQWPTVDYDQRANLNVIKKYNGTPIPVLVVVDRYGRVVSTNASVKNNTNRKSIYNVLDDLNTRLQAQTTQQTPKP